MLTANQILGVRVNATQDEIAAAYRALAKRFHPDRHANSTERERSEAAKRMAEVNEAYAELTKGVRMSDGRIRGRPGAGGRTFTGASPWDEAAAERRRWAAAQAEKKKARERTSTGVAVGKPKPLKHAPVVVSGMGIALVYNYIDCRGCGSLQRLPEGWKDQLDDTMFHCSECDRLLLSHRVQRGAQPWLMASGRDWSEELGR